MVALYRIYLNTRLGTQKKQGQDRAALNSMCVQTVAGTIEAPVLLKAHPSLNIRKCPRTGFTVIGLPAQSLHLVCLQ